VHLVASVSELTRKGDDLTNDQFGDRPGIREGGVEHADAVASGIFEVDLISADAEAAYYY
jgi:hypothetical protein